MQFISDRQSLAQQFVFQTQKQSSYLLSSRASRRRIVYEQSLDAAQQQIQDFKQQIEQKYKLSIANKIYTFPFEYNSLQMFDDSELQQLQGDVQISLYHEQQKEKVEAQKFKILNKKIKNEKVNNILAHIKSLKQNMLNLTLYNEESLYESSETKPTNKICMRKSKSKNAQKSSRLKITYETINDQQDSPNIKRHLQTEPYQKPLGYIVKKK